MKISLAMLLTRGPRTTPSLRRPCFSDCRKNRWPSGALPSPHARLIGLGHNCLASGGVAHWKQMLVLTTTWMGATRLKRKAEKRFPQNRLPTPDTLWLCWSLISSRSVGYRGRKLSRKIKTDFHRFLGFFFCCGKQQQQIKHEQCLYTPMSMFPTVQIKGCRIDFTWLCL